MDDAHTHSLKISLFGFMHVYATSKYLFAFHSQWKTGRNAGHLVDVTDQSSIISHCCFQQILKAKEKMTGLEGFCES